MFALIWVVWIKIGVTAEQLADGWDDALRILWSSDFEVIAFDLDLLKDESLGGLISRSEVHKGVVSVTTYPGANDWFAILKDTGWFA